MSRGKFGNYTTPYKPGLYNSTTGVEVVAGVRSYTLVRILRQSGLITYSQSFDVYANATQAKNLAIALNETSSAYIVVLLSTGEPQVNRMTNGLPGAIYNCGGSAAVFASSRFYFRSAYMLIGVCNAGFKGFEYYAGSADSAADAAVIKSFEVTQGSIVLVSTPTASPSVRPTIAPSQPSSQPSGRPSPGSHSGKFIYSGDLSLFITMFSSLNTVRNQFYRVVSRGLAATNTPYDAGLYNATNGTMLVNGGRSYTLIRIERSTGLIAFSQSYDVFGNYPTSLDLANALYATSSEYIVVVLTFDEPSWNHLDYNLPQAIYNCGGTPNVFASDSF